jgi:hypothetical protein
MACGVNAHAALKGGAHRRRDGHGANHGCADARRSQEKVLGIVLETV